MNNPATDHAAKEGVEIIIRQDGLVIWINVDGICKARIITNGFIPITLEDNRKVENEVQISKA